MHRESKLRANRSPGPIYTLPSDFDCKSRRISPGFGTGDRFKRVKKSSDDSPGPAGIVLSTSIGRARAVKIQTRKSFDQLRKLESTTISPGPASPTINVRSTVGDSRAAYMHSRDAWLDRESKLGSQTSALRQLDTQRFARSQSPDRASQASGFPVSPIRRASGI